MGRRKVYTTLLNLGTGLGNVYTTVLNLGMGLGKACLEDGNRTREKSIHYCFGSGNGSRESLYYCFGFGNGTREKPMLTVLEL